MEADDKRLAETLNLSCECRHVDVGEVTLHVAVFGVRQGREERSVVVLLHGFPEFWFGWRNQIVALVDAGHEVWVPDQRGYNLSEKPRGIRAYGLDRLAADVEGLVRAAGVETAAIIGHDWGAAVAWWTAISRPHIVAKLIVINVPHPIVMQRFLRSRPRQTLRSWYFFVFQLPWLPEMMLGFGRHVLMRRALKRSSLPKTFSDDELEQYVRAWSQADAMQSMVNWYRAALRVAPKRVESVRVQPPTMIIWGERDEFLDRAMVAPSAQLCESCRIERFPEATHWVQHEEPTRVNELILTALRDR